MKLIRFFLIVFLFVLSACGNSDSQQKANSLKSSDSTLDLDQTAGEAVALSTLDFVEYTYLESDKYRKMSNQTFSYKRTYGLGDTAHFKIVDRCTDASKACSFKKEINFKVPNIAGLYWAIYEGHAFPINVVDLSKKKSCLLVSSFTFQAYSKKGGHSFYTTPYNKPLTVSLERPIFSGSLKRSVGAHSNTFPIYSLAKEVGLEIHIFDDLFLHQNTNVLSESCSSLIFSQHPEYWTEKMYFAIKSFIESGKNILNFSANIAYWKTSIDEVSNTITVDKRSQFLKMNRFKFIDKDVTSIFGGYYLGYPVERYASTEEIYLEKYPVISGLSGFSYDELRKIKILNKSSSLFSCLPRDVSKLPDTALKIEVDGIILNELKKGSGDKNFKANIADINGPLLSAWAVYGKSLREYVVARDFKNEYGGRVISFGSIGWSDFSMKNENIKLITKKALATLNNFEVTCAS